MAAWKSSISSETRSRSTPWRTSTRWTATSEASAGQRVRRDLPPPVAEPVGEIEEGVAGILSLRDPPGHSRDPRGRVADGQQLERSEMGISSARYAPVS